MYAAVVFAIAAVTDFLDGRIARKRGLVTNLGKFLDPIADKVLVSTAFVLMLTEEEIFGLFGGGFYVAGAICVCLILARELIISAFRQIAAANGVVLAADMLGKTQNQRAGLLHCGIDRIGGVFGYGAESIVHYRACAFCGGCGAYRAFGRIVYRENPDVLKTEK